MTRSSYFLVGAVLLLIALPVQAAKLERLSVASGNGRHFFAVEVARDDKARDRGLMGRHGMDRVRGMLLVYDPPAPVWFWMDRTYIPLDMLFIAADGRIISITENAKPLDRSPSRAPPTPARCGGSLRTGWRIG